MFFAPLGILLMAVGILFGFYLLYLYLAVDFPGGILKQHVSLVIFTSLLIMFGLIIVVFAFLAEMVSILKRDVDFLKLQSRK